MKTNRRSVEKTVRIFSPSIEVRNNPISAAILYPPGPFQRGSQALDGGLGNKGRKTLESLANQSNCYLYVTYRDFENGV